ncbi:Protein mpe1, variant 3 [Entomophthora muscae]|uniref:Protein mpe1, variant 3 n=1 Tax=Entomophthora muscae TaxID=34485 RepID=A0ACC2U8P5_9FUNG|nr:Protein mpe1, variant 3 [Entomophthora muscae]
MSMIHYKFRSAKDFSCILFDGQALSLFELKRDILIANRLKGTDFDIILSNAQSDEDYSEDSQLIPRNTSVYVRRVPARAGGTNAQHYLTDNNVLTLLNHPMNSDYQGDSDSFVEVGIKLGFKGNNISNMLPVSLNNVLPGESEEDKLQALLNQSSIPWNQSSTTTPSGGQKWANSYSAKNAAFQGKPTSANYICHRCGIKGHFVQNCSSSSDRRSTQPEIKRTTGIPRSFLKNIGSIPDGKGAMITNDGALVVAKTNEAAWKKIQLNQRGSGISAEELRETAPVPPHLECDICTLLLTNAVSAPCCKRLFCFECVTAALLDKDPDLQFKCPSCETDNIVPDALVCETAVRAQVDEHLRLWATERLAESRSDDANISESDCSDKMTLSPQHQQIQSEPDPQGPPTTYKQADDSRSSSRSSIPIHASGQKGSFDSTLAITLVTNTL